MKFLDQNLDIFKKGKYKPLNRDFIAGLLLPLTSIQHTTGRRMIHLFNGAKNPIVAFYLNFYLVNEEKHGLYAKREFKEEYLEVKQVSYSSKSWSVTFNDTTLDKADAFKDKKTMLAVGIWNGMLELICIIYGQNPEIGYFLEQKVKEAHDFSRRSTQTISCSKLLKDYKFKIKPINVNKKDLIEILSMKFKNSGVSWGDYIE
ncbi:hypothetical protein [Mycoplasmopsis columboralis]|uniref:Uncharacterized protein n=1 Tax=Mycoplasmopsis columboralis TaxID=171282 RepID=A0A449B710_9BACT|nr:hypothetical protein [Mycoplasmopsis columboralis]VEU76368.1 Uncharacterised protein [Mycoplasmopsis columboralis]